MVDGYAGAVASRFALHADGSESTGPRTTAGPVPEALDVAAWVAALAAPMAPATKSSSQLADPAGCPGTNDAPLALAGGIDGLSSPARSAARIPQASSVLIDQIRALEELKGAAAGRQAVLAAAFDALQRRDQESRGVPVKDMGKGVGAQIALARRDPPAKGARHLGLAKALVREMPHTLRALQRGRISEWRATLLVRETACLSLEDRMAVDEDLAGNLESLEALNDKAIVARAKQAAYRLDAAAFVKLRERSETERNVTCRPAPGGMVFLSGLLTLKGGVSALAALDSEATLLRARGDSRSRGQIMADAMIERLTGAVDARNASVEIQLVMTDRALFDNGAEPAYLPGYGVIPAPDARALATSDQHGLEAKDRVRIRRLFTYPGTGELVGMEARSRLFPESLQRLVRARDQVCRTPWCGAPIRHADHVKSWASGGPTSAANAQGLCERCNQTKELAGWSSETVSGLRHTVETTTPTGHVYLGMAPPLPGTSDGDAALDGGLRAETDVAYPMPREHARALTVRLPAEAAIAEESPKGPTATTDAVDAISAGSWLLATTGRAAGRPLRRHYVNDWAARHGPGLQSRPPGAMMSAGSTRRPGPSARASPASGSEDSARQ
ncbi:HNH endonuclease [Arthrobacter sp. 35W]|uniref:HNH endonuclease n=1 Tax=Arthrobacter sp. 35W TaxID=1132441 RepID=UPI0004272CA5|nr:HNH endonuclease signature motif containing protein [Arthrobacter sp. 35W]